MTMLKAIPWLSLFRSAFLAILTWAVISALLLICSQSIPAINTVLALFLGGPMGLITNIGVGFLIGALALYILEKSERFVTVAQLWFLVLFSAIGMFIYDYFPIRVYRLLIAFNQITLVGIVLGIFLCGKKHWR